MLQLLVDHLVALHQVVSPLVVEHRQRHVLGPSVARLAWSLKGILVIRKRELGAEKANRKVVHANFKW